MALVTRTAGGDDRRLPAPRWLRPKALSRLARPRGHQGRDEGRGRRERQLCRASGWGVRLGATDGQGAMVCPVCEQTVKAPLVAKLGPRVCVIVRHT